MNKSRCPSTLHLSAAFVLALLLMGAPLYAADQNKKLRLAYAGWEVGTAVAYVGVDAGLFKQNGLLVEEIPIRDTLSAGIHSLLGVDLLIGFGNPLAILQPLAAGADVALIGAHVSFDDYGMGVGSGVSSIKELQGKKIGVSGLGSRSDLIARVILRRAGLDPAKDVEIVAAGLSPARALAVAKNLIQGAPLTRDVAEEAKKLGIKILDVNGVPVVTDLLITTRSYAKREEDTMRRFMKGYAAAIHHFVTRREDSLTILKKYFPASQGMSLDAMYDVFLPRLRPLPELNKEAVQALVDVGSAADQKTKTLKPADLIESRFIDELKGSRFLKDLYAEKVSL
ncbi:MAG TPA: ABC transporter substrate-binding protein [Candidatus Binatia bacterium]|nr:ABC transporter substrate-binding protein [Candidatus Binatia bacterium]